MSFSFKGINWANYLMELILLVLGITIAFSIDRCTQRQGQKAEKESILSSLVYHFEEDLANLKSVLDNNENIYQNSRLIVNYIRQNEVVDSDSLLHLSLRKIYETDFTPFASSIVELKARYDIDKLELPELKQRLERVFNGYQKVEIVETQYRQYYEEKNAFWDQHFDFIRDELVDEKALEEIYFQNLMARINDLLRRKSDYYKEAEKECQEILAFLKGQK